MLGQAPRPAVVGESLGMSDPRVSPQLPTYHGLGPGVGYRLCPRPSSRPVGKPLGQICGAQGGETGSESAGMWRHVGGAGLTRSRPGGKGRVTLRGWPTPRRPRSGTQAPILSLVPALNSALTPPLSLPSRNLGPRRPRPGRVGGALGVGKSASGLAAALQAS